MPSLARPSLISAAVIALPLSLMAARGNHKELVIGRKAVDHRRLLELGPPFLRIILGSSSQ
jgi:hypothetical protein